jgi:hypothetical protein
MIIYHLGDEQWKFFRTSSLDELHPTLLVQGMCVHIQGQYFQHFL